MVYTKIQSWVKEVAVLGNVNTGIGQDPIRTAYSKYNTHYHNDVSFPNFFVAGVSRGQMLNTTTDCSVVLFNTNTIVETVSASSFTISSPALATLSLCELILSYEVDDEEYYLLLPSCNVTAGSNTITLGNTRGFTTASTVSELVILNGHITDITTDYIYCICPYLVEDMYLKSLAISSRNNTITDATFKLVSRMLGATTADNDIEYPSLSVVKPVTIATNAIAEYNTSNSTTNLLIPKGSSLFLKPSNVNGDIAYSVTFHRIKRYFIDMV